VSGGMPICPADVCEGFLSFLFDAVVSAAGAQGAHGEQAL